MRGEKELFLVMGMVILFNVCNTVARKIMLVPLKPYPFHVAQFATLAYCVVYSGVLVYRYRKGHVTREMLNIPKMPLVLIGFLEAISEVLGNIGTSGAPGYLLPLLSKLNVPTTAVFSYLLLKQKYTPLQLAGMVCIIMGCVVTLLPTLIHPKHEDSSSLAYVAVFVISVIPVAVGFVIKESIFLRHQQMNLDIFVVSTYGSLIQMAFSFILLPAVSIPLVQFDGHHIPTASLSSYISDGFRCIAGYPTPLSTCKHDPYALLIYMMLNLMFNISLLMLLKLGGAVLMFITTTISFPLASLAFALPWPIIGAESIHPVLFAGLALEIGGMFLFKRYEKKEFIVLHDAESLTTSMIPNEAGEEMYDGIRETTTLLN